MRHVDMGWEARETISSTMFKPGCSAEVWHVHIMGGCSPPVLEQVLVKLK